MRAVFLLLAGVMAAPGVALAQLPTGPIPPVVLDVRGFYPSLGQDPVTAAGLGVAPADLPSRGLGGVGGVHVFLFRGAPVSLGVGGEVVIARGRRTPEVDEETGAVLGQTVEQRLQGLSTQLSLNFGDEDGWSYLTGGMGPMRFETFVGEAAPAEAGPRKMTINMGGGARWFPKRHIAFTFDVRFYLTRPETATPLYPGRQRSRLVVLSAGLAFK